MPAVQRRQRLVISVKAVAPDIGILAKDLEP
jgi:hypothetical protein